MAIDTSLPRTPIEWFMLAPLLIFLNIVVLLLTNHTLPAAVAMGAFYGITMALVLVIIVGVWSSVRGDDETEQSEAVK